MYNQICWEKQTKFPHPVGIVIATGVKLGNNYTVYQNSTLGTKRLIFGNDYPQFGENVVVGANAIIIENLKIGNNIIIGTSTAVSNDFPIMQLLLVIQ